MEFQGNKQTIFMIISIFTLFCCLMGQFCAQSSDEKMHYNDSGNITQGEKVDVGVILDMGSREGKIILSCISVALSDFYHLHNNYSTRVVLHSRDSKGKPLHSLSAALELLDNIKVEAIIGAQTKMEANLLAELGEAANVPVMSLSELSPSPYEINTEKNKFFIEITRDVATSEVMGINALLQVLKWNEVILLYANIESQRDIVPSLVDSFQEKNVYVAHQSFIALSSTNEEILEELQKIKALKTTVLVVHVPHFIVPRLLLNAEKLGLMSEGYAWIITSASMNFLHSLDSSVIESMQGVLGLKSYIPPSTNLHSLTSKLRRKFYLEEPNMEVRELSANEIWAYDAIWALAKAVEKARSKHSKTRKPDIRLNLMDLDTIRHGEHGIAIVRELLESKFNGLSGEIEYRDGKLSSSALEIINVIGKGERRIGFWHGEINTKNQSHHHSDKRNLLSSNSTLKTIIWPGGSTTIGRGYKTKISEVKLRIGVPVKLGFKELVRVDQDLQTSRTIISGFCIDVFKAAINGLPYKLHYEFIPYNFTDANGHLVRSYDDLLHQLYLQNFDMVVGDITITSKRSLCVDFTIPYTDLGVGILVPKVEDKWVFLKPLSANLWITSAGFFILTGVVVWLIERPTNEEFQGSISQQVGVILWFSFSTLAFAHREKLLNNLAKFVVIIWVFVVLILTSSYTATLASMMTVKQIQLTSKGNYIGYQIGSYTRDYIDLNVKGLKQYIHSAEEYNDALTRGSKHGGISAMIDEVPYIKIFLAKYHAIANYSVVRTKPTTNGFGFAFPKGSPLVHDMSRQIESLREEGRLSEMEKAWFHSEKTIMAEEDTSSDASTLDLYNFEGLFLVSGISSAFCLFLFTIFSLKEQWHAVKKSIFRFWIQGQVQQVGKKAPDENEQIN